MKMSSLRDSRHANIDSKVRKINSLRDSQVINKVFFISKTSKFNSKNVIYID